MIDNSTLDYIRNVLIVITTGGAIFLTTAKYFFNIPITLFKRRRSFFYKESSSIETIITTIIFAIYSIFLFGMVGTFILKILGEKVNSNIGSSGVTPVVFSFFIVYIPAIISLFLVMDSLESKFYGHNYRFFKSTVIFGIVAILLDFFSAIFSFSYLDQIYKDTFSNILNKGIFVIIYLGIFIMECGVLSLSYRLRKKESYSICYGDNKWRKIKLLIELGDIYMFSVSGKDIVVNKSQVKAIYNLNSRDNSKEIKENKEFIKKLKGLFKEKIIKIFKKIYIKLKYKKDNVKREL